MKFLFIHMSCLYLCTLANRPFCSQPFGLYPPDRRRMKRPMEFWWENRTGALLNSFNSTVVADLFWIRGIFEDEISWFSSCFCFLAVGMWGLVVQRYEECFLVHVDSIGFCPSFGRTSRELWIKDAVRVAQTVLPRCGMILSYPSKASRSSNFEIAQTAESHMSYIGVGSRANFYCFLRSTEETHPLDISRVDLRLPHMLLLVCWLIPMNLFLFAPL